MIVLHFFTLIGIEIVEAKKWFFFCKVILISKHLYMSGHWTMGVGQFLCPNNVHMGSGHNTHLPKPVHGHAHGSVQFKNVGGTDFSKCSNTRNRNRISHTSQASINYESINLVIIQMRPIVSEK